jgi:hypothetical protein
LSSEKEKTNTTTTPRRNDPTRAVSFFVCYKATKEGRTQGQADPSKQAKKNKGKKGFFLFAS